ncbi:uncharacterized protein LOC135690167 [Rhopilema esculentum]|uniref:uncharacterized protein LOC135690167 n=1 Tax=Rhopilema esculentum TaxID=499914 RepID=UPI0031DE251D
MENSTLKMSRDVFIWKNVHDECLVTELLVVEPYNHKPGSKERGLAWKQIAENLNSIPEQDFRVTARSVRDRFLKLLENFKKNEVAEKRASGIQGVEYNNLYHGMLDISERMEEAQLSWAEAKDRIKVNEDKENKKAEDMRMKAVERLGETRKRKEEEDGTETPKRRKKAFEAVVLIEQGLKFKQENANQERELKKEELNERRLARENLSKMMEGQQTFMQNMMQQQQQFMLQMQQTQMQTLAVMSEMISTINNTKNN